jgi:hypothetical protein
MVCAVFKKALGAQDARKEWCQCANELGEMVSWEAKNNPRYKGMKHSWDEPPPPPPK